ncbi:MAG: hypothetical protein A3G49_01255 [Candidatus Sungbacteria bacterium RIFCSPLOWO2_12_FULL_41_11]|uniref:HicB-like antitoxin of toxin-antitoxin system domain-containing protein n=1 Tax=Candidatus Sungbacteria bacterium RIFCSPLOWO2_12_FULL_41_11 TaxID=1802286 RepID=A0A1G2LR28_9BACT|nr:MAG: hypothetical protein UV01_C0006G0010 [Parcubacteria group bacterium GW2011_GWA2_42_14]OGZ97384.1 MAG: hypothetical protein A3D41_05440 [Candidatus Sungbacteria bacterium RIFCSPHIGHO2_02_FULL_41_12b]OHA13261.1 MAG: hypothetical protein A3G49_01255 [Candidatus Sungbacteria bacterium RIFCSPLOWO2_12_FULL_41_11]
MTIQAKSSAKGGSASGGKLNNLQLPLFVEKDEDGFYVVECPLFERCYSQGKTLDEALKNICEAISLIHEPLMRVGI